MEREEPVESTPAPVYSQEPAYKPRANREASETSSQKRAGYTSYKKDDASSSKKSGPKEAVRKMKVPSDREESVHIPMGKSTAKISYGVG